MIPGSLGAPEVGFGGEVVGDVPGLLIGQEVRQERQEITGIDCGGAISGEGEKSGGRKKEGGVTLTRWLR